VATANGFVTNDLYSTEKSMLIAALEMTHNNVSKAARH
jgi:hypothetical protein